MDFKTLQILILAGLLCSSASAQVSLDGTIADANGMGIADVEASLPEYGIKAVSDSNGMFHLEVLSQSTSIRNYAPQSNAISADGNYRVFVPNGARRLLPYSAIGTLRDGVYYLVPGRSYRAEIKITVMGGQVISSHNIRKPEVAESTSTRSLRKESTTTDLVLVRAGVIDTTVSINPSQGSINLKLPPAQGTAGKAPTGTFTDVRDGSTYNTIIIGNQEWFAENLRYDIEGSLCPVGIAENCAGFGHFYDWKTASTSACPVGWRLPSEDDWRTLEGSLGMSAMQSDTNYWRGSPYGKALKSASAYWLTGTQTNESGFQAVPAGFYNTLKGRRDFFGAGAFFWSSTEAPDTNARARVLLAANDGVFAYHYSQGMGMSVRCMKKAESLDDIPTEWPNYCKERLGKCGIIHDSRDGKDYRWTKIGEQKWMAENLNYGIKVDGNTNQGIGTQVEKYCYNNLDSLCNEYGGLYQWHQAVALSPSCMNQSCKPNTQGICPDGWHIPSSAEWNILREATGNIAKSGQAFKAQKPWYSPITGTLEFIGSDLFGFSGLPNGGKTGDSYTGIMSYATWWSSSESSATVSPFFRTDFSSSELTEGAFHPKSFAWGVRCLSD